MNIDISQDPQHAYEEGWRDALRFLNRKLSTYRDEYLMPENEKILKKLSDLNVMLNLLDSAADIQSASAWMQDNKLL